MVGPARALCALTVSALLLSPLRLPAAERQQTVLPAQERERRQLYLEGVEAIQRQEWRPAHTALNAAYSLRPSYDVALFLAQAEFNLGQYRSAAEHLEYYLRSFPAKEPVFSLFNAQRAFEISKRHVAALTVRVNRSAAEVFVDGRSVGRAPLGRTVFLDPGSHVVSAQFGQQTDTQSVAALAGQSVALSLRLPATIPTTPAPRTRIGGETYPSRPWEDPTAHRAEGKSLVPVILGGAGFVGGAATAVGFGLAAAANDDHLERVAHHYDASYCTDRQDSVCDGRRALVDRRDRNRTIAVTGLAVAGASLVGTALYWFWPRKEAARTATVRPDIQWAGHGANVNVVGAF